MIFTALKYLSTTTLENGRESTNITANFRFSYSSVPEDFFFEKKNNKQTPVDNRINIFQYFQH
jgi:hypothetical protein